jgi:glycosyltransferase involved in cell wall biosynthesis
MIETPTKILFVYTDLSSFVKTDLEILKRHFDVAPVQWTRARDVKNMLRIIWHILRTDLSFTWFAGGHAARVVFLSKLFGKKSIVVVGGYEVANVPEIGYGAMIYPKSARKVKYVLENADKILAVSKFNKNEILKYTSPENVELVYNSVDCDKFKPNDPKDANLVITVGSKMKLKGLDIFIESAKLLIEKKFMVIGLPEDVISYLKPSKPANVELVGFVSHEDILQYYQSAEVYCQLSCRESFGMALAEAMVCECVPVAADNAALPEVVGDTGFYVPYGDPKATAEAIEKALQSDKGEEARKRVKMMFSLEKRENELMKIIKNI